MAMGVDQVGASEQCLIAQQGGRLAFSHHLSAAENKAVIGDVFHQSEIVGGGDHSLAAIAPAN